MGLWTHLAAAYDSTAHTITLYVNGVKQGTAAAPAAFNATGPVVVGRGLTAGGASGYFAGAVDQAEVYDRVVTADELTEVAKPLAPAITFPAGDVVWSGQNLTLRFDAHGDANVTSYAYSVNDGALDHTVALSTPGSAVSVTYPVSASGDLMVFAVGVTAAGLRGDVNIAFARADDPPMVSGTVTDATTGAVAAGVTVQLEPGGVTATTGVDGTYHVVPPTTGTFTVSATTGTHCPRFATTQVDVQNSTVVDLRLAAQADAYGYTCTVDSVPFTPADTTVLPLTGDDQVMQLALPFSFPYYGTSYNTAWLDTNGAIYFSQPRDSYFVNTTMPSPSSPNNMLAPFWADIRVDASSIVRSSVLGSAPNRKLVLEWRNVYISHDAALARFSFEAILAEDGTVTFDYSGLTAANTQGSGTVVGIESPGGHVGLQYSAAEAVLANNTAVTIHPPAAPHPLPSWTLSGRATLPGGAAAAGATVWLEPMGITTTTNATGQYQVTGLESGDYTVTVSQDPACGPRGTLDVHVASNTTADVGLTVLTDGFGYSCSSASTPFVPADTTVLTTLTGDDKEIPVTLPFGMRYYGTTYTTVYADTNGTLYFTNPTKAFWAKQALPTAATPNNVVAPFWTDLKVDASASVRTTTIGAAPNRQFVIEWRNVLSYSGANRFSFEVLLGEDGTITFNYSGLTTPDTRGSTAAVGIENSDGTVGFQCSYEQATLDNNRAITFRPPGS